MSQEYDNNLRGVLFRNEDKQGEKHPDYKGNAEIDGTEYWISAWIKTSKKGQKFMSLSFKPKEERANDPPRRDPSRAPRDDLDDIAF